MLRIKQDTSSLTRQSNQGCVPLKKVSVDAYIKSFAADVTIKQIFQNDEANPIEAVYCFPIEENAAIYSFIARIDDREIVSQLKEKNQAQKEYSDALQQGHGAYLLEQDEQSQDNFIINVGALPAGKECHISISYVSELDLVENGSRIRFVIPTTIAPRYNPDKGNISSPVGTTSKYVQTVPYTITLNCRVEKNNVSRISSTSHPIQITLSQEDVYMIEFSQQNTHLDRDILIDIELTHNRANTIIAVEPGAVMASFTPTEEDCKRAMNITETTNEFIFIVDCSGSMEGENKIELAREAMLLFLKSLPVNCQFNIIRFGSNYKTLFNKITETYNEENAQKAEKLAKQLQADLGGTELLRPLQWLEQHSCTQGRARQIFLLTDGEISNVDEVLDLCRSMASSTRIFSFGLGLSPSRSLVKGLARATNGRFVFIPPNTSVDIYVGEQLQKALESSITNLQVKWNLGTDVMSAPTKMPPVYANDRLIIYALINDPTFVFSHSSNVELHTDKNRLSETNIGGIPTVSSNQTIARLAAKALIIEMQHSKLPSSTMKSHSGSLQARFQNNQPSSTTTDADMKEMTKKRIIELSLKYQILSPHTAFIGVEKRINSSNDDMVLREVPICISADDQNLLAAQSISFAASAPSTDQICYASLDSTPDSPELLSYCPRSPTYSATSLQCCASSVPQLSLNRRMAQMDFLKMQDEMLMLSSSNEDDLESFSSFSDNDTISKLTAETDFIDKAMDKNEAPSLFQQNSEPWPTDDQDIIRYLINKQKFDGLWSLDTKDIERLTGKSLTSFPSLNNQQIVVSAIVIITLETRFTSLSNMWRAMVQKSRKRLLELLGNDRKQLETILETIRQAL